MRSRPSSTARRAAAGLVLATALLGVGWAQSSAPSAAEVDACPPGYEPVGPGVPGDFFDANVSVFAGGSFRVEGGAAEAEGVVVALGDASFDRSVPGTYNVGVVGVGSGVPPHPGSDMLVVGGDVTADPATRVDVGAGIGGDVVAGGVVDVPDLETNGGEVRAGVPDATDDYDDLPALIAGKSAAWLALPTTGTVNVTPTAVTLTGDGMSDPQVFTVSGADFGSGSRSLEVTGVPDDVAVVVNLTGPAVSFGLNSVVGAPPFGQELVDLATRLVWNIPDATTVAVDGSAQLPGSILVAAPGSTTTVSVPGTNGRVWVAGDLVHTGDGAEMHNYPFLPDDDLDCKPLPDPVGSLAVTKVLDDADDVVPDDRVFTGSIACTLDGADVTPADDTWSTTAGAPATVISDELPVGAVCTLQEVLGPPPAPGYAWEPAVVEPASVVVAEDEVLGFTVTNSYRTVPTEPPTTEPPTTDPTTDPTSDPTSTGAPTTGPPTSDPTTPGPTDDPSDGGAEGDGLPDTGAPSGLTGLAVLAVVLVVAGVVLLARGRLRDSSP